MPPSEAQFNLENLTRIRARSWMFGWFRKKTPEEKAAAELKRLLVFPNDDDVKVSKSVSDKIAEAEKLFSELVTKHGFETKGWSDGWPREISFLRERETDNTNTDFRISCDLGVGGEDWDRLKVPKFHVELEASAYDEEQEECFDLELCKYEMTLARAGKFIERCFEEERSFLDKFKGA